MSTGKHVYCGYYDPESYYREAPDHLKVYVKVWNRPKKTNFNVGDHVVLVGRSTKKVAFYNSHHGVIKKINYGGVKLLGFVDPETKQKDVSLYNDELEITVSIKNGGMILNVKESDIKMSDDDTKDAAI